MMTDYYYYYNNNDDDDDDDDTDDAVPIGSTLSSSTLKPVSIFV